MLANGPVVNAQSLVVRHFSTFSRQTLMDDNEALKEGLKSGASTGGRRRESVTEELDEQRHTPYMKVA